MGTHELTAALNECVTEAIAQGDFETARNICDAHPGEISPDLFWTVEAQVANVEDELVEEPDEPAPAVEIQKPLHERFDLTDAEEAA